MKKKTLFGILALLLIVCISVCGTFAYILVVKSVKNVFTVGNVDISLAETAGTGSDTERTFKIIPGEKIDKDPKITVDKDSEKAYLFLELNGVAPSADYKFSEYITYTLISDWKAVDAAKYPNVYYIEYKPETKPESDTEYGVFVDNKVSVVSFDKAHADAVEADGAELSLTVYAGACQMDNIEGSTAAAKLENAWLELAGEDGTLVPSAD